MPVSPRGQSRRLGGASRGGGKEVIKMTERIQPRIIKPLVNLESANKDIYQPIERERFGNLSVIKFGGAALSDAFSMERSVEALARHHENGEQVIVVVSAMADVTDALDSIVNSARSCDTVSAGKKLKELYERHLAVLAGIPLSENGRESGLHDLYRLTSELYSAVYRPGFVSASRKAEVLAQGERMAEFLFATYAKTYGLPVTAFDSSDFIITDSEFENARPDLRRTKEETRRSLEPVLKRGRIPIVTGFFAANDYGKITLLGRNCSDYTAGIIAGSMRAKSLYLYKDVDGIMTGNPKIDPNAVTIDDLTYEGLYQIDGASKVIHPKTIEALGNEDVTIWIKNVFNPSIRGTRIVRASQ